MTCIHLWYDSAKTIKYMKKYVPATKIVPVQHDEVLVGIMVGAAPMASLLKHSD